MAMAGTPLMITGNIFVSRDGQSTPNQMGADEDAKIPALAELTSSVHRHGGKVLAQLSHCGRQVVPRFVGLPEAVSASAVRDLSIGTLPRPLTIPEIERIVADFAEAAGRCKAAGFEGVQIHAGHGYLIGQFLTPYTNRRTDAYGGSLDGRTKLLRDTYRAMRDRVGPDYPIIIKINGSDWLPLRVGLKTAELVEVARIMEREGVDAVEV
jgi:2,4-dienoyl-CoA reductase-like NADH-dependent reductase (Old Yellow Enzyme family)